MEENGSQEEIGLNAEQTVKPPNKKMTILNFILIFCIFIALFVYMLLVDRNR